MGRSKLIIASFISMLWLGISLTCYAIAKDMVNDSYIEKVRNREYSGGVDEQNLMVRKKLPKIRRLNERELQERFISSEEEEREEQEEVDSQSME